MSNEKEMVAHFKVVDHISVKEEKMHPTQIGQIYSVHI